MQGVFDRGRFRRLLAAVVEASGVGPYELARRAGFHGSQIGRWRKGETHPSYARLAALGDAVARERPGVAATLVPALFDAAGYVPPVPPGAPDPVAAHWADPVVRAVWLSGAPEVRKLRTVAVWLDAEPGGPVP